MTNRLDLSRLALMRGISREMHGWVRLLYWLAILALVALAVFYGGGASFQLGKVVRHLADPADQGRLLAIACAWAWLVGFGFLSRAYYHCLFAQPALTQLLTMPITTRQIFTMSMKGIVKVAMISMFPALVLWVGFLGGRGGWDFQQMQIIPLLVILQGVINLVIPLFIALYFYRIYRPLWISVGWAGYIVLGLLCVWIGDSPKGDMASRAAVLRIPWLETIVNAFPGSWVSHFYHAVTLQQSLAIHWLIVILLGCLVTVAAIVFKWLLGYTEETILSQYEWAYSSTERERHKTKPGYQKTFRELFRFVDVLFERWFTPHQRAMVSLSFFDDWEGDLGRRWQQVVLIGLGLFALSYASSILIHDQLLALVSEIVLGLVLICGAFASFSILFAGGHRQPFQPNLFRGFGQVPLHETMPFEPEELVWTCFRFRALQLISLLSLAPALFAAPFTFNTVALTILLSFAFLLFLSFVISFSIMLAPMRHPHRTVWADTKGLLITGLGSTVMLTPFFLILFADPTTLFEFGFLFLLGFLLMIPLNYAVYRVWLWVYCRRNFDVEPWELGLWFQEWSANWWRR